MDDETSMQPPSLGYIYNPANNPFETHINEDEHQVPRPHRRWRMLDTPVHPLWRWQAWKDSILNLGEGFDPINISQSSYEQEDTGIPLRVWNRMEPALRLATLLLHRARPFFAMLLSCPLVNFGPAETDFHFDPTWNPRPQDIEHLDSELLHFAQEYRIFQTPHQTAAMVRGDLFTFGITTCARNTDVEFLEFATKWPVVSGIAVETMQEFGDGRWDRKPANDQFVVLLSLAQTLVHELAHAIFYRRKYLESMFMTDDDFIWWAGWEPQIFDNTGNELGLNMTLWLFGFEFAEPWGIYHTVDDETQGIVDPPPRPLMNGSGGMLAMQGRTWSPIECYRVSRKTLKWLFDRDTWSSPGPIPLHLVRTRYRVQPDPVIDPNLLNPNLVGPDFINPDPIDPNLVDPNLIDPNLTNPNPVDPDLIDPCLLYLNLSDYDDDDDNRDPTNPVPLGMNPEKTAYTFS